MSENPNEDALVPIVAEVNALLRHPEMLSRAMTRYVVTRWVSALAEAGVLGTSVSVPMSTRVVSTKSSKDDDGTTTDCQTHHISVLGHEIVSWGTCHTGSSTGSGHTSIEVTH